MKSRAKLIAKAAPKILADDDLRKMFFAIATGEDQFSFWQALKSS